MRSKKKDSKQWEAILNSDMWALSSESILPALRLSYCHLASHLKPCFAYCAIFPRGYEFQKDDLVLQWMAEGLLHPPETNMDTEEIDDSCFQDLASRLFFQPSKTNEYCFTMHDLIHDLAKSVSGEFCKRLEASDSCKISKTMRYLSYRGAEYDVLEKIMGISEVQHLRSFAVLRTFVKDEIKLSLFSKLKRLRVLSLPSNNLELSDVIGNWKHLRYLNLSGTPIKRSPEIITTSYNLQILILHCCKDLAELPIHMARKKRWFTLKELGKLQHLRGELSIHNLQNVEDVHDAEEANLKVKRHLRRLKLRWEGDGDDSQRERNVLEKLEPHLNVEDLCIDGYNGTRLPDWLGDFSFSTLAILKLEECRYCSFLPPLGQLTSLKELWIIAFDRVQVVGLEFYGSSSTSNENPFRSLEILRFEDLAEWHEWIPCVGAFPRLQKLYIFNCPILTKALPNHLLSLTTLQIERCHQLVVSFPAAPSMCIYSLTSTLVT
ncbi:hypothetical protein GH714_011832 [Hevea brasiliensis]|uniref:NB-ARC domain-containing protein n=1 Tax=Hevea brasiliensis TaxID=3981 RepID=A0A6A6NBQ4_HEVBR|nr:hypothetical protein GH714_011832 [Hevea brasiliensis]